MLAPLKVNQTAEKPLLRVLRGEALKTPPVWLMRQAGRYLPEYRKIRNTVGGFLDLCYSPALAAEVTLQPIRRYGFDAAILFSDILVVPDALGQSVRFEEGGGPKLDPIRDVGGLGELRLEGIHDRLAPIYETVSRLSGSLPENTALIGFAGSPWTVATYMVEGASSRDFVHVRGWAQEDPGGFERLIGIIGDATAEYLCRQVEAGAEILQLFDSWAGVLPQDEFRRWVVEPTAKLTAAVKKRHPGVPIIGFPRSAGQLYEDYIANTGIDAVSLDSTVPLDWAARQLQARLPVQGNLDPLLLLAGGAAMERRIGEILAALSGGPFIFNLGHGIIKETPPDHVAQLMETVRGWAASG